VAAANRFLEERGLGRVIVVGGYAVELLTGGATRTLDVDLVVEGFCAAEALREALTVLRRELPSSSRGPVLPLAGAEKALDLVRVGYRSPWPPLRVEVEGYGWFYLEAPEQLVMRYLREHVYWGTEEARRRLILLLAVLGPELDLEKLRKEAAGEDERLLRALDELIRLLRGRGLLE
jgi:hypothetical protein